MFSTRCQLMLIVFHSVVEAVCIIVLFYGSLSIISSDIDVDIPYKYSSS